MAALLAAREATGPLVRHGSCDLKVGELGHRIGLRPQSDPPICERLVLVIEQHRAVEIGLDLRARGDDTNRMPHTELRLGDSRGCDRTPLAVHDAIEPEVVLERVGAYEEVVLSVRGPEDDSAARVFPPGHGPEAYGDIEVAECLVFEYGDGPGLCFGGLSEDVAIAG